LNSDQNISSRKLEHIDIVLNKPVDYKGLCDEYYRSIILIHQAFPGIVYDEVDLTTRFLKHKLDAPIVITGITGGHSSTVEINRRLVEVANRFNIAIGVGSQRAMLVHRHDNDVIESYRIVRRLASNIPVIGNIGLNTLSDLSIEDVEYLIEQLEPDALAIHLNPAQELIQPEGDTRFNRNLISKVEEILDNINIPVIIKEVGTGLSYETIRVFYNIGVRYFDVAGACGTNWILVEKYRGNDLDKQFLASILSEWGIPTPLSVIETRYAAPNATIIASGGVWDGLKACKNIALGADLVGLAKPVLKHVVESLDNAVKYMELYIESLKAILFLTGSRNLEEFARKPVVVLDPIKTYMVQRGIDPLKYFISIGKERLT